MFFKKRVHRPWKPDLLENTLEDIPDPQSIEATATDTEANTLSSEYIESKLKQALEQKDSNQNDINAQLNAKSQNSIIIGGFLHPKNIVSPNEEERSEKTNTLMSELKNQEQEILLLGHDLKIAKAIEHAEKTEISRRQEEIARKAAEEKALFAIQEAKKAAEKAYRSEQQVHLERRNRLEEEKARKTLENELQSALRTIRENEVLIQNEEIAKNEQARLRITAEESIEKIQLAIQEKEKTLELQMQEKEQQLQKESQEKIDVALAQVSTLEQKFQKEADEKVKCIKVQMETKLNAAQKNAEHKIQEAQEQAYFHEKAKLTAQSWTQKSIDAARQTENAKKELEKKLVSITSEMEERFSITMKQLNEEKTEYEQRIEALLEQIRTIEETNKSTESNRALSAKLLAQSIENTKKLESIIETERNLRKVIEKKMSESEVRKEESKRKLSEDKVIALEQRLSDLEADRNRIEEKLLKTQRSIRNLEIMKIATE